MTDDNYPFAPAPDRKQAGSPLLDAALAYAARRLPVFPLIPCGKTPAIKRSFHDATLNPQTIRRHWRIAARNIGIATGASSRAWVLDIDGEDGEATLRRLEARYGSLPPTREVITGGGGRHLWFEYTVPIPSTAGRIGLGVDTRGDRGYVVVPPSVHPNGRAYEWAEGCDELAVAPDWLVRLALARPTISERVQKAIRPPVVTDGSAYARTALEREAADVASAGPGTRNYTLNRAAFSLFQLVAGGELDAAEVTTALEGACERNGLGHDDGWRAVKATIASGAEFERVRAQGVKRVLLVAPTASGKTVIAADIIQREIAAFRNVVVVAHTREIIRQTSQKLFDHGIAHGIVQAGFSPRPLERVQVASIQTLHRRAIRSDAMNLPPAQLLVIDECHHCPARTYQDIIKAYPDATLVGLTATPCRGDGRGLGGIFEVLIECPQVPDLIALKFLVPTRVYAPVKPDLRGVKISAGDYAEGQLAKRMNQPKLIGDIVSHWFKYGERRKTVAFAVNVEHSVHLRDEFIQAGVRAEHIDGSTPKPKRDASLARLASGEIELITNCLVLTEGFDLPDIGCIILARPTKKMGLYRQMIGRALRPAAGKVDAVILDHAGTIFRHGFAEDRITWTLDPTGRAEAPKHTQREAKGSSSRLVECTQCGAIREGGKPCCVCGFLPQRRPRAIEIVEGNLGLVDHKRLRVNDVTAGTYVRAEWLSMLAHIAEERGYKRGWVAYKFKEKFGMWPPRAAWPDPKPASMEVYHGCAAARSRLRSRRAVSHERPEDQRRIRTADYRDAQFACNARLEPQRSAHP
jgi:DNA repair protein RadD